MAKTGEFVIMRSLDALELIKDVTHDSHTLETARQRENAFIRNRKMPFPSALCFMLDMRKTTLQTRLNLYFEHRGEEEPMSQQAFSKLRSNFDHSPFVAMHKALVRKEYSGEYDLPLWNGYHLFGIDGSFAQLPRNGEMYRIFGIHGQKGQCPSAGVSVLFDVLHGWAVDPAITTAKMNERTECEKHIESLCNSFPDIAANSVVLMDRGYPSKDLFETIQALGVKFVARCKSGFLSDVNNAPLGDSIVNIKNGVTLRVIKFMLPSGIIETLATNLFDIPESLFPDLYALRWGVETAYFRLKQELCVEKFSGKTANSIYQDFWASMVLLNSVSVFQKEADAVIAARQNTKNLKYLHRARTSDLIVTLRDRFIFAVLYNNPIFTDSEIERLIRLMARSVSPIRPGRSFPRNPKPFLDVNHNLKSHL